MTQILDGKSLSEFIGKRLERQIKKLKVKPKMVILQVGDNKESNTYIKHKKSFAEKIGAQIIHKKYPEKVSEKKLITDIKKFNKDKSVHGILLQLPIPIHLNAERALDSIDQKKDIDGLTSASTKSIFDRNEVFLPATTNGILALLDAYQVNVTGKKVVIVGQSSLVGRPTALAFLNRGATVTVCHSKTQNLESETKQAEILIVAVGSPNLIGRKHVSKKQIVIDVGINVTKEKKIVGDVDFKEVSKVVKAITPVPGGVGPMTVASLLQNLLQAYYLQR